MAQKVIRSQCRIGLPQKRTGGSAYIRLLLLVWRQPRPSESDQFSQKSKVLSHLFDPYYSRWLFYFICFEAALSPKGGPVQFFSACLPGSLGRLRGRRLRLHRAPASIFSEPRSLWGELESKSGPTKPCVRPCLLLRWIFRL